MKNVKLMAAALLSAAAVGCASDPDAGMRALPRPTYDKPDSPSVRPWKLPFRIGFAGYSFCKLDTDRTLAVMKRIDAHCLCIKPNFIDYRLGAAAPIAAFKAKCAAAGVECRGAGPLYFDNEADARRLFEFAKAYGIRTVVVVPFESNPKWTEGMPARERRLESDAMLDVLDRLVKEFDIRAAIHNHGPDNAYLFPTAESVLKRVGGRDKRIGVCLDVGHERRAGLDPAAFIRKHGDRVYDVHLKNIRIDPVRNLAKEGPRGELDIAGIFKALVAVGYTGVCHIEYEKDFEDNLAEVAESFGYYRGVADALAADMANFVTIDPGHFHASLVQNRTYPEVASAVKVFAPAGSELDAHLKLVEAFNTRTEKPTAWTEDVYRGADYLAKFAAAAKAGDLGAKPIVILAGKNSRKGDYALAAVEAGANVLSDKPMAITPEVFAKTEKAARLAEGKGLLFADIMTERNEITTILQRALAADEGLYGEQEKGTPDDPAVTKISVHHFCKLVNGAPLRRPEWYYDTAVQGEGIADVTTHLVDLVQWETFPGVRLAKDDVKVLAAKTWPTVISPEQYRMSTGGTIAKPISCEANGEFTWELKGVNCKVSVVWNFMAPKGTGDTHYSLMRGTKAELTIEQGAKEGFRPVLYVKSRGDADATGRALAAALARIAEDWPGVRAEPTGAAGVWRVAYPAKYDIGHEAHFSQVVRMFLDWMNVGREDPIYVDNMIVKYHTIVEAWKKAHGK